MNRRRLALVPLLLAAASVVQGQQIRQLTRSTAIAGLNDSALVIVSDSALLTRAGSTHELFKRPAGTAAKPSYAFALDSTSGMYRFGKDTIGFATGGVASLGIRGGASVSIFGGAGNMNIRAGTGNSRNLTLQVTDNSGNPSTILTMNGGANPTFTPAAVITPTADGTNSAPTYSFNSDPNTGVYRFGADTLAFATGGAASLGLRGGAAVTLFGGAGDMVIQAGTGASRILTLQTTTAGSATQVAMRFRGQQAILGEAGRLSPPGYSFATDTLSGIANTASSRIAMVGSGKAVLQTDGADTTVTTIGPHRGFNGTATIPSYSFTNGTNSGMYLIDNGSTDTLTFATNGTASLKMLGGGSPIVIGTGSTVLRGGLAAANTLTLRSGSNQNTVVLNSDSATFLGHILPSGNNGADLGSPANSWRFAYVNKLDARNVNGMTITGGVGASQANLTILAGTGTAGTMVLQSSNSAGAATTFATGSGDTVKFAGHAIATAFTAAAGTPGSVCYNTATSELTKNNATSCVVSSIRFKTDVSPLSPEWASSKLMQLRPSSFTYRDGGRRSLGLIAENADSVDSRLGFRNADGTVNSYDQPGVIALLIATVQKQQLQIDSLRAAIARKR